MMPNGDSRDGFFLASLVMPNGDPRDGFFYPTFTFMIDSYSINFTVCHLGISSQEMVKNVTVNNPYIQECGNTMPDFSDLVPFHSEQVRNFYLLVLGQV